MPTIVRMELPADVRCVRVVTACATELLATREPRRLREEHDILLALQEACMNVIDHAYRDAGDARFDVAFTIAADAFVAEVTDRGASFDPSVVPPPDFRNGQVRGYGIFLMHALLDEVTYTSTDGVNRLRLVKRFHDSQDDSRR